jgi:hypothetical protein
MPSKFICAATPKTRRHLGVRELTGSKSVSSRAFGVQFVSGRDIVEALEAQEEGICESSEHVLKQRMSGCLFSANAENKAFRVPAPDVALTQTDEKL